MLYPRNSHERVNKLVVKRLTIKGGLSSLASTMAGFWQRGAAWLMVALGLVIAGCASTGGGLSKESPPDTKAAVVSERAQARWNALIKGDLDKAYSYMSEASQQQYPLRVYKDKTKPGMWKAVKIDSVDCNAEICKLKLTLTYDHRLIKGVQTPLTESWIIENGTAWYVYQPQG